MQYSSVILAVLAATGAIAAPTEARNQKTARVLLQNSSAGQAFEVPIGKNGFAVRSDEKWTLVTVEVGTDPAVKALRCKLLDQSPRPVAITATRGANKDITFADGDKGEWTFVKASKVGRIICDPAFKANSA